MDEPVNTHLRLRLTPRGHLTVETAIDAPAMERLVALRLDEAFTKGSGAGLFHLGASEIGSPLPPHFAWWRSFAARYINALCHVPDSLDEDAPPKSNTTLPNIPAPGEEELLFLVANAPIMPGAEYLTPDVLDHLWNEMAIVTASSFAATGTRLQDFLKGLNPVWNSVGRVHFNLAENRRDPDTPFAFIATYTTHLSSQARAQHLPLGQALRDFAGADYQDKLLSLLKPVQRAAETCAWLKQMIDGGQIFHPLRWRPQEAAQFLHSAADLERAGIVVRMPNNWKSSRPARARIAATVGSNIPSGIGMQSIMDFSVNITLDGTILSDAEITALLASTESLIMLRGQWVEVDRDRLEHTLHHFQKIEALARKDGMSFLEAMRLLAGAPLTNAAVDQHIADWSQISAGPWLAQALKNLRAPDGTDIDPGPALHGTLRPYQKDGVQWLYLLATLGLGACLADDMGLGKTIQVLSLLLALKQKGEPARLPPCLLVVPASLLANWAAEINKFTPSLTTKILHPSVMTSDEMRAFSAQQAEALDLVITSYGTLLRIPALSSIGWRLIILDEAQAIKNPNTKQTRAAKALQAHARIALTGTPVENNLGDLWSIFDFITPGLLGNSAQFGRYVKGISEQTNNPYGPLRELVRPYIMRRMKTDRSVIADLPDKTELKAYCYLSSKQAVLYAQAVDELTRNLTNPEIDGIQKKGMVLAMLMRLKQICNHPAQWLNHDDWAETDSGKLLRLREIAETVATRQEKMLVFTQFREAIGPLNAFLEAVFGRPGLVLHGETPVRKRQNLVKSFQENEDIPFFILSLKAGGTGLTLTAASHVVHFDRWWNPAVENQATDRAFRIGQKSNVLVHKFICRGTVEEKIDAMIEAKQGLSDALLTTGGEMNLTEMTDEALLRLVSLDLNSAMKD